MAIYTDPDLGARRAVTLEKYHSSLSDSLGAAWDTAMESNPVKALGRMVDYMGMTSGDFTASDIDENDAISLANYAQAAGQGEATGESYQHVPRQIMADADQERAIEEAGLAGYLRPDPHYDERMLAEVIAAKKEENDRALVMANAPAWHMVPGFAAGMAAGMTDPLNIASMFIPVVPAATQTANLARAGSMAARAIVRARAGALSGAVGAAAVEPLVHTGQQAIQADYDMAMSLQNIMMGATLGAGMHAGAGAIGDWRRGRAGIVHPWEIVEPTEQSETLRRAHVKEIEKAYREAGTDIGAEDIKASSLKAASDFDAWARQLAYSEKIPVEEVYRKYTLDIRSGEPIRAGDGAPMTRRWRDIPDNATLRMELEEELAQALDNPASRLSERGRYEQAEEYANSFEQWARETAQETGLHIGQLYHDYTLDVASGGITRRPGIAARPLDAEWRKAGKSNLDELFQLAIETGSNRDKIKQFNEMPFLEVKNPGRYWDELGRTGHSRTELIKEWAKRNYGKEKLVENDNSKMKIGLRPSGIKSALYHGHGDIKLAVIPYLEDILKTSVYLGNNLKKFGLRSHFFVNKVKLDGQEHIVSIVARGDVNGLRFYDHQVSSIINPLSTSPGPTREGGGLLHKANKGQVLSLSRTYLGVNDKTGVILFQKALSGEALGAVRFTEEDTRALIRIFRGANVSTAIHEFQHVLRRFTRTAAMQPQASTRLKGRFQKMCDYVGAEYGAPWTRAQEEKFARAYEKYLLEGKTPVPFLRDTLEDMKERMRRIYNEADFAGLEITPQIREVFDSFNRLSPGEAGRLYRNAIADLVERDWAQEFAQTPREARQGVEHVAEVSSPAAASRKLDADFEADGARFEERLNLVDDPQVREVLRQSYAESMAAADREIGAAQWRGEMMEKFIACSYGG